MEKLKSAAVLIVLFAAVFVVGALTGRALQKKPTETVIVRTDTLIVRDTIREIKPVFVHSERVDTMLVPVRDTVTVHDTTYITIEREQRHYRGEDWEAWVSGYRPALDSLNIYRETKVITNDIIRTEKPKRWGIGVQVGGGMTVANGRVAFAPYIGVGISYNLIRF